MLQGFIDPPNKPVTDYTQFIPGVMDYTNRFHTVFAGDTIIDVMNNSNVKRNYIKTFQQYSFVNEINLPTFISPSGGSAISLINHVWHNLNVVPPAFSDNYAVCVIFKV